MFVYIETVFKNYKTKYTFFTIYKPFNIFILFKLVSNTRVSIYSFSRTYSQTVRLFIIIIIDQDSIVSDPNYKKAKQNTKISSTIMSIQWSECVSMNIINKLYLSTNDLTVKFLKMLSTFRFFQSLTVERNISR